MTLNTNSSTSWIMKLKILLSMVMWIILAESAMAQVISIENISPTRSNYDVKDPNSSSGGRVNGLAANPTNRQHFLAASEWGGLYESRDAGQNWNYISGHIPQVTWDVEFNPSDPLMIVATSFFDGKTTPLSGINISRDGGLTWAVPPTSRPEREDCIEEEAFHEPAAYGIAFDPSDNNNIFVGTNCGLAVSNDNGESWRIEDTIPEESGALTIHDVIVHNDGVVDVCGDEGHQRSENLGEDFNDGANEQTGRCSLAVSPDEKDVLFMSVGVRIFSSRNGGNSWPRSFVNPAPQGRIPFLVVNDRAGKSYDLWFGDTQLFRASCTTPDNPVDTVDRCPNSSSWTNAQTGGHWDVGDLVFNVEQNEDACPVIYSNDGGIYINTRENAINCQDPIWEQPVTSVTALWLWDMEGNPKDGTGEEGIYIGQQDSGAFGTKQGPQETVAWDSPGCCDIFDVEAEENRVVYTTCCFTRGRRARIFIDDETMDGGAAIPNSQHPPGNLVTFRDTDSITNFAAKSYAVVTSSGIFFTSDISKPNINWKKLGVNQPSGVCGIHSSQDATGKYTFYARVYGCSMGESGPIWKLEGASTSKAWKQVSRTLNSGQISTWFGAFGVNPSNPDHIITSDVFDTTSPEMVVSEDGGTTWNAMQQLDQLLIGNGEFVSRTRKGIRWGDGKHYQTSLIAINPNDSEMIVAAGQNSGVFLTIDGGENWNLITDPISNNVLRPHISRPLFAHFEELEGDNTNIYLGARGRGVWRVALE